MNITIGVDIEDIKEIEKAISFLTAWKTITTKVTAIKNEEARTIEIPPDHPRFNKEGEELATTAQRKFILNILNDQRSLLIFTDEQLSLYKTMYTRDDVTKELGKKIIGEFMQATKIEVDDTPEAPAKKKRGRPAKQAPLL